MPPESSAHKQAFLFNLHELKFGTRTLRVEFYAGDILSRSSDALLTSGFVGDHSPQPGTVLGAIATRFGIVVPDVLPAGTKSFSSLLHRIPTVECFAFRHLWLLEIKQLDSAEPSSLTNLHRSFEVLNKHIAQVAELGVSSLSLPLLGAGDQKIPLELVVSETLQAVSRWVKKAPSLQRVRLFARNLQAVATLNLAIDQFLSQSYQDAGEALGPLIHELHHALGNLRQPALRAVLGELGEIVASPHPSSRAIAVEGRRVAEVCAAQLVGVAALRVKKPSSLNQHITLLQDFLRKRQPLMLSYLRLLQSCGNLAAHSSGIPIAPLDAVGVAVAAVRLVGFTEEHCSAAGLSLKA